MSDGTRRGDSDFSLEQYLPYLVHRVGSRLADGFARFESGGVSLPEWRVLAVLYEYGPQTMGDIARRTSVNASTLTRLIGAMEARALVRRERRLANQRTVHVRPLAEGRRIVEHLIPQVIDYEAEVSECFTEAELQTFRTLLVKLFHSITREGEASVDDGETADRLAG